MATALVFKVRDPSGALVASCKLLTDAAIIACRHGKGAKISHMHLGVLATVGFIPQERIIFEDAKMKLDAKREEQRQEYERTLEEERQRMLANRKAER